MNATKMLGLGLIVAGIVAILAGGGLLLFGARRS